MKIRSLSTSPASFAVTPAEIAVKVVSEAGQPVPQQALTWDRVGCCLVKGENGIREFDPNLVKSVRIVVEAGDVAYLDVEYYGAVAGAIATQENGQFEISVKRFYVKEFTVRAIGCEAVTEYEVSGTTPQASPEVVNQQP